jgi:hypothetical protein
VRPRTPSPSNAYVVPTLLRVAARRVSHQPFGCSTQWAQVHNRGLHSIVPTNKHRRSPLARACTRISSIVYVVRADHWCTFTGGRMPPAKRKEFSQAKGLNHERSKSKAFGARSGGASGSAGQTEHGAGLEVYIDRRRRRGR